MAEPLLRSRGVPYSYRITEYAGHAVQIAKEAQAKGERFIVSAGGDGTAREIGGAICGTDAALGLFPFGTGNDLARAFHVPSDIVKAVEILLDGDVRNADVGHANDEIFLNVSGFGFDVDVVRRTEKFKKKFNGMLPYMLGIMQSLIRLKSCGLTIRCDGHVIHRDSLIVAVANGTHFGGGMNVAPDADPFDGLFDVCLVQKVGRPRFLSLLPSFVKGRHVNKSVVSMFRTGELYIESDREYPLNLDGELGSKTPVRYYIEKGALRVLVPQKATA